MIVWRIKRCSPLLPRWQCEKTCQSTNDVIISSYLVVGYARKNRLRFFGHAARSYSRQIHHRVISASLRPPRDWRKPRERPRTTWLRGLLLVYSRLTSVFTQPGGRPATVFCGDVSSTRQHSIRGTPLKKIREKPIYLKHTSTPTMYLYGL